MKPPPKPPNRKWAEWPQELAPSEIVEVPRWPATRRVHGINAKLLACAQRLSERTGTPIHEIVVFYPRCQQPRVTKAFDRVEKAGLSSKYRGLTVAPTPRLQALAIAFRLEDVENHRTPADAYYILVRRGGKPGEVEVAPKALYEADESGLGSKVDE